MDRRLVFLPSVVERPSSIVHRPPSAFSPTPQDQRQAHSIAGPRRRVTHEHLLPLGVERVGAVNRLACGLSLQQEGYGDRVGKTGQGRAGSKGSSGSQ
jgi:hypothetical protein